jgi:predicted ATPase/class 3 adenylate cyclase
VVGIGGRGIWVAERVLPSGTVTFLFTDIEQSTESAAALGDARWAEALATHRDLLRPAFEAHGGVEVGTEGDAFFVAFSRAGDAVAAAIEGLRALEEHAWPGEARIRVRMGLHTGEVLVRDGDYVGHDVHKAKRISDAGHGGQILVSEVTAGLISGHLPNGVPISDLGPHRLKDLGEAQRLFQVGTGDFAPLRSLEAFTHNLPPQRTTFVGREGEIVEVTKLLANHRLVTLTGVGGCGKTRLAIQVGAEVLDQYPGGVFFVDLAALADPDGISSAVANAVGASRGSDIAAVAPLGSTGELLLGHLSRRTCLILLDNCEHLLDAVAELADGILLRCPGVTLLATSREALDVEGEQSWRVPSLSVPAGDNVQSSEAVSLFKTRAQSVRPEFELTPQNAGAVGEICRRLDGIPLAIEFAAARIAHLAPAEIAERLNDMFTLLAGGRRRRVQRQQTLQAALDWSYELLSDAERILLRRLAVFPASFSLAAVEGVCTGGEVDGAVLDLLGSLVAKSLVTTLEQRGATRYRLIETVRAYAAGKLREAGESDTCRNRHRDWFLSWVRETPWEHTLLPGRVLSRMFDEYPNLRAALEWSEAHDRLDLVVAMAARCGWMWVGYASPEEGYRWLTIARPEDLELSADERVGALAIASLAALQLALGDAGELADRAVAASDGRPSIGLVRALCQRAINTAILSRWTRDQDQALTARRQIDEALELARGWTDALATVHSLHGLVEVVLGDIRAAELPYRACMALRPIAVNAMLYATVQHILGAHEQAYETVRPYLGTEDLASSTAALANSTMYLGAIRAGAGDVEGGRQMLAERLERARASPFGLELMIVGFAVVAFLEDDLPRASRLLAWVRARTFDRGLIIPDPGGFSFYEHYVGLLRAALPREDARRYRDEGRTMSEDEAVACALGGLHT